MLSKRKQQLIYPLKDQYALVYGACTETGQKVSKLLNKFGYNLLLIDSDLTKLQKLQDEIALTSLQEIRILNVNVAMLTDSTSLEQRIFKLFFDREPLPLNSLSEEATADFTIPKIPVFVNCATTFQLQTLKLFHEFHFD